MLLSFLWCRRRDCLGRSHLTAIPCFVFCNFITSNKSAPLPLEPDKASPCGFCVPIQSTSIKKDSRKESYIWCRRRDCLGFAPRSESFAFEPAVQLRSISSLSGLTSCRPSANPLETAIYGLKPSPLEHIKKRITIVILFLIVDGGT